MKNMKTLAALTMLVCLAIATGPTFASIASTGGAVIEVSPQESVKAGETESDTQIIVFAEQQYTELSSDLAVDIVDAGTYTGPAATLTPGTISAGTFVNSYLLHFDPVTGKTSLSGSVTFEEPILGLIVLNEEPYYTLNNSDDLGASGTTYPTRFERRMELIAPNPTNPQDQVIFSADRKTITVTVLTSARWQDQVRIITSPVQAVEEILLEMREKIQLILPENLHNENAATPLTKKIEATLTKIAEGSYQEALDKLQNDILKKTDGCDKIGEPDNNDWILTCEDQAEVYPLVMRAIELLQRLVG